MKLIILVCFWLNISYAIMNDTQVLNHAFFRSISAPVVTAPQSVTDSWADLGSAFDTKGVNKLGMLITKTINNSENLRFRIVGSLTADGATYLTHSKTVSSGVATADDYYIELADDDSNNVFLSFDLERTFPYTQIQVHAGTVGETEATIDSVAITKGR